MTDNPLKVLLIEDNPGDARLIREMLGGPLAEKFHLVDARGLAEGAELLALHPFALVLLDLSLGETQGLETFRRVHQKAPAVPVVVLTGSDDEALAAEALQAGAQDYLVKGQVNRDMLSRSLRYAVERGRVEEQLRQRAAELAESSRRKDEFLAILSHELRNPLSPLVMAAEFLSKPDLENQDRIWVQGIIERQVQTLTRLVDDLLDISRISRGKIALRLARIDLSLAVKHAADSAREIFRQRRHELTVNLPPEPLWVDGDAVRLEQVITNLLTNAAKYTPDGGHVWIEAVACAPDAVVRVRDTGIGIPPEMLDRVFELFTQVDSSISRSSQWGMGIGLALVRGLVELHGGAVTAASPGPGAGSEFAFKVPLSLGLQPLQPARVPAPAAAASVADCPRRILVVEDQPDSAASLERLLQSWKHHVRVARSGPEALALVGDFHPDVVVLDIGLPDMDGYEVAQRLRQQPALRDTMLLALTGYGRNEDRQRAAQAGFNYHITKPVDLNILKSLLSTPTASTSA